MSTGKRVFDKKIVVCIDLDTYTELEKEADNKYLTLSAYLRQLIMRRKLYAEIAKEFV